MVREWGARHVLRENNREASFEVEVDVAVEEPWARVVRPEADGNVVVRVGRAGAHDVAPDRVVVIVLGTVGAADDRKGVLRGAESSSEKRVGGERGVSSE